MEILFPDFWTMLWDYGIYLYKNVSQIKMFRPKVIEAEYLNSVIVTNEKFCKQRGKLYMNYIHSIFLQNSIYLYPEKKKKKNQKKNPNKTIPITQGTNLQNDFNTNQPISNTNTSPNPNTNQKQAQVQTTTTATTTTKSRSGIKNQNSFFLSTFWHSVFGVEHQPNVTKISKLVSSILQPSQIQRNAQTKIETETETVNQPTTRSSRRRSTRSNTKNLMELQSLSNIETNLNTLNSQKLNFSSHESSRIARTIGVLGFQIIKTLQNSTTKRENISTFSGFSRQRVCTVITIYSAINLIKENSKTGVISWNKRQARSITDFDLYSKRVIKLRELKRRFGIKLFQLAIQFHQKNNRLNQNRNFIDTSEMILDLIFGKLSEIGLNYKKLTSSNIQNEIPEKKVKMHRELEETIKFFQNQSKILKLFGKKNNNKKASNLTQKSEKKKLINNIQNNNNNLIINHNNNKNNNNYNDDINNYNDNNNANSNKNKNENNNNNLDNNNTQNNGIKKNNQINKINGNINFRLNMVKPETNVKTRTKKKKNKAKKIRRKKINHNMTLNTKIKKEMIKKNVSRSPTRVESIYDNFIFKSQETNNNININNNNNNNNNNNVNTISTNQKSEINNNFTTPNNFNNNTNNQINQSMIFNQNNPKLYLTSPNLNFLPTPILSQTPPQTLMPTLASTIYQMPSILPMPLPQPIEEQKKSIKGSTTPKSSFKTFPLNNTKQVPKDLPKGNFLENGKQYQNYNSSTLPTMQTPRTLGEMAALPNIKYNMNYQRMGISPQTMPTPSNLSFDTQSPMLSPFFPTLSPSPQISPSPINTFFPAITFLPIIQLDQTQQHQFRQQQIKQQQQQIKQQQQQIKQQQLKQQQQQQQIKQQQIKLRQQSKQQQPQLQQNTHFQQLLQQEYSFPSFPFFNRSTAFPPNFKSIKNIQNQNVKLDQKKTKKEDKK
ncbi:hypothetical protein M0813_14886 [Anaeramoeba flamelloides]|uniref:Uncharacterized protein n=1 Tax=Anaeramoeba flamelloides TaxID=1746091 RepID=A0ABQ8Z461_9EUKA|nr:hypothetical protein M0813_14886 [Anaeramoeba flamelloides]